MDLSSWSESATAFVYQREPDYQRRLADLARDTGAPLLFGSPAFEKAAGGSSLRNRAYLLGADGEVAGWQDKQQLVPFGEFVPFSGCSSSRGRSCRRSGTSSRGSGRECSAPRRGASARSSATR